MSCVIFTGSIISRTLWSLFPRLISYFAFSQQFYDADIISLPTPWPTDRLKSEALRLHPALDPRDKPPLNPPPPPHPSSTSTSNWLQDLKRSVENENHRRGRDAHFAGNEVELDHRDGRRDLETPAKRTFYDRGSSFEDDKENESRLFETKRSRGIDDEY